MVQRGQGGTGFAGGEESRRRIEISYGGVQVKIPANYGRSSGKAGSGRLLESRRSSCGSRWRLGGGGVAGARRRNTRGTAERNRASVLGFWVAAVVV